MTKRVKKNPKDKFERELWELWDAMKRAMDKQEAMRGSPEFWTWIAEASKYWNFLNTWEALVGSRHPDRLPRAYVDWIAARLLGDWTPSQAGPLFWGSPISATAGNPDFWQTWTDSRKAAIDKASERLRKWLDKGITKHRKAKAKKEKDSGRVESTSGEDRRGEVRGSGTGANGGGVLRRPGSR